MNVQCPGVTRLKFRLPGSGLGTARLGNWRQSEALHLLELRTFVNGALVSESLAPESLRELLPRLTQLAKLITLEPGDVISVPWPAADGNPDPCVVLRPGDVVAAELDGLGTLENSVALTRPAECGNKPQTLTPAPAVQVDPRA
jgi:hypothetical protein